MSVLKVSEFICGQLLRTEFLRTNIKLKQIVFPAAESGLRLEFFLGIWLDPSTKNSKTKKNKRISTLLGYLILSKNSLTSQIVNFAVLTGKRSEDIFTSLSTNKS